MGKTSIADLLASNEIAASGKFSVLDDSMRTPFDGAFISSAAPLMSSKGLGGEGESAAIADTATTNASDEAWQELTDALTVCLGDLDEDDALVISHKFSSAFVQFVDQGAYGLRAEAVGNAYLPRDEQLSAAMETALISLGWHVPTYIQVEGSPEPSEGSPNYFVDAAPPVPYAGLAMRAMGSLRHVYGVRHPGELQYKAYNLVDPSQIRFPSLKLKRMPVQDATDSQTIRSLAQTFQQTQRHSSITASTPIDERRNPASSEYLESLIGSTLQRLVEEKERTGVVSSDDPSHEDSPNN